MPVIAVDFDDVLIPFNQGFLAYHNKMHGTAHAYEDLFSYTIWNSCGNAMLKRLLGA